LELSSGEFLAVMPLSFPALLDAWVDLAELPVLGLQEDSMDAFICHVLEGDSMDAFMRRRSGMSQIFKAFPAFVSCA
jgi:hypothetical protein